MVEIINGEKQSFSSVFHDVLVKSMNYLVTKAVTDILAKYQHIVGSLGDVAIGNFRLAKLDIQSDETEYGKVYAVKGVRVMFNIRNVSTGEGELNAVLYFPRGLDQYVSFEKKEVAEYLIRLTKLVEQFAGLENAYRFDGNIVYKYDFNDTTIKESDKGRKVFISSKVYNKVMLKGVNRIEEFHGKLLDKTAFSLKDESGKEVCKRFNATKKFLEGIGFKDYKGFPVYVLTNKKNPMVYFSLYVGGTFVYMVAEKLDGDSQITTLYDKQSGVGSIEFAWEKASKVFGLESTPIFHIMDLRRSIDQYLG